MTRPPAPMVERKAETIRCADYRAHQSQHRFRQGRWACEACAGQPPAWAADALRRTTA